MQVPSSAPACLSLKIVEELKTAPPRHPVYYLLKFMLEESIVRELGW
jgi:hypothetical protein